MQEHLHWSVITFAIPLKYLKGWQLHFQHAHVSLASLRISLVIFNMPAKKFQREVHIGSLRALANYFAIVDRTILTKNATWLIYFIMTAKATVI